MDNKDKFKDHEYIRYLENREHLTSVREGYLERIDNYIFLFSIFLLGCSLLIVQTGFITKLFFIGAVSLSVLSSWICSKRVLCRMEERDKLIYEGLNWMTNTRDEWGKPSGIAYVLKVSFLILGMISFIYCLYLDHSVLNNILEAAGNGE